MERTQSTLTKVLLYAVSSIILLGLLALTMVSVDSEGYETYHKILFITIGVELVAHIGFSAFYSLKSCKTLYRVCTIVELALSVATAVVSLMLLLWSTKVYEGGFGIFPLMLLLVAIALIAVNAILFAIGFLPNKSGKSETAIEKRLGELQRLLDNGTITKDEYDTLRAKALESLY